VLLEQFRESEARLVQARGGLSYTPGLGRYVDDAESTTDSATTNLTNDHHSLNYARKAIRQMTLPFARSLRMSKHTHTHTHNRFTAVLEYVGDHPGEQVPER